MSGRTVPYVPVTTGDIFQCSGRKCLVLHDVQGKITEVSPDKNVLCFIWGREVREKKVREEIKQSPLMFGNFEKNCTGDALCEKGYFSGGDNQSEAEPSKGPDI